MAGPFGKQKDLIEKRGRAYHYGKDFVVIWLCACHPLCYKSDRQ
jgi:hypothetical protein